MRNKSDRLAVTGNLNQFLNTLSEEQADRILKLVSDRSDEIKKYLEQNRVETMLAVIGLIDRSIKENPRESSCKKGCNFCCHINVDVSEVEAELIVHYCEEKHIQIDKDYLLRRRLTPWREVPLSNEAACTFLKDGECGIYPVRPLACRTYFVGSEPIYCDASKYRAPAYYTTVVFNMWVEIEFSGFINATRHLEEGRMEDLILKYLKNEEHDNAIQCRDRAAQ